ncbi:hypothetical protein ABW19_dt0205874 [Dactylella cylindrospora]|nr:hypothetical protein ABW19_dt0205874 [Dactylella cylindrospora]
MESPIGQPRSPSQPWLPVELVIRIYQECNTFADAIALASTCSYMRAVWKESEIVVLGYLGKKQFVAFDEGIAMVRCINLATERYQSLKSSSAQIKEHTPSSLEEGPTDPPYTYPPPFSINEITKKPPPPTLSEIRSLFSIKHLIDCLFYLMRHGNQYHGLRDEPYLTKLFPSPHDNSKDHEIYLNRVYQSMYRLLASAALHSTVYMQPFLSPTPQARRLYRLFTEGMNEEERKQRGNDDYSAYHLSSWDLDYLQQFPCFNHQANRSNWKIHKPVFEMMGDWIVGLIDASMELTEEEKQELDVIGLGYDEEEVKLAWRIQNTMLMLDLWWALNTFMVPNGAVRQLVNDADMSKENYVGVEDGDEVYLWLTEDSDHNKRGDGKDNWIKTYPFEVRVFFPGMYQPQLVTLPRNVSDSTKQGVYLLRCPLEPGGKLVDIPDVLHQIQVELGAVAPYSGFMREPQMELAFASFVMREYYGVRFGTNVFTPTRPDWLNWAHFGSGGALWRVGKFLDVSWPLVSM